jgi:RimJ/RimL family protein N-acetyltransferase
MKNINIYSKDLLLQQITEKDLPIFYRFINKDHQYFPGTKTNYKEFKSKMSQKFLSGEDNKAFKIYKTQGSSKNKFIGFCSYKKLNLTERSVELGAMLFKKYQGYGDGKKTLYLLTKYLKRKYKIRIIWGGMMSSNKRATAMVTSLGWKLIKLNKKKVLINRKKHDELIYEKKL